MKKKTQIATPEKLTPRGFRNPVAVLITILATCVTVFCIAFILVSPNREGDSNLTFIGHTLLPLLGTGVGSLLAYYFGKINRKVSVHK